MSCHVDSVNSPLQQCTLGDNIETMSTTNKRGTSTAATGASVKENIPQNEGVDLSKS